MENETGTSEAHEAPAERPDVVVSPSRQEEINTSAPDGAQPAAGQTAEGPKKRRRGRRGGKRHRRKTPGTGTATATPEQPSGSRMGRKRRRSRARRARKASASNDRASRGLHLLKP